MKTFKEFLVESKPEVEQDKDGYDILNTKFGSHSKSLDDVPKVEQDKDGNDILNTTFGKHSIEESKSMLAKHYNKFTENDKNSIRDYTQSSWPINNYLHEKATSKKQPPHHPEHERDINNLNQMVHRHKTPQALTVYSGVHQSPEHLIKHQRGDKDGSGGIARTSNFTSTSTSKSTASDFAYPDSTSKFKSRRHILKIHIPKGHPGAYVEHHSANHGEDEFILPHKTKMHIHHEPKYDRATNSMIWTAHVLPHED